MTRILPRGLNSDDLFAAADDLKPKETSPWCAKNINTVVELTEKELECVTGGRRSLCSHIVFNTSAQLRRFGPQARFAKRLNPGDRVVFAEMGAYTFCQANWFNGVRRPAIVVTSRKDGPRTVRTWDQKDFTGEFGGLK